MTGILPCKTWLKKGAEDYIEYYFVKSLFMFRLAIEERVEKLLYDKCVRGANFMKNKINK